METEKFYEAANDLKQLLEQYPVGMEFPASYADRMTKLFNKIARDNKSCISKNCIRPGGFQMLCGIISKRMDDSIEEVEKEIKEEADQQDEEMKRRQSTRFISKRKARRHNWWMQNDTLPNFDSVQTVVKDPLSIELSLERTPFYYVTSSEQFNEVSKKLANETIFAYDMERTIPHFHNGLNKICLIQITTAKEDFVIDLIQNPTINKHIPRLLKKVFEDERITKVVHGNDDRNWLRREFAIESKGEFDTSFGGNLPLLVYKACGVKLQKSHQTSDWLQRPLSYEMVRYARLDTHYLLRCYEYLQNNNRRI